MSIVLSTKLQRASISPRRVDRPRLRARLDAGLAAGHQVLLVSAPAGYGKTTCVSEWAAGLALPVAWLGLDPADDEPGRFFTYFIAALQTVAPGLGEELLGVLHSGMLPPSETLAAGLINELHKFNTPFLLILDDLHLIQDDGIGQVLELLVSNQPGCLRLVLLTREDPGLPLARLRARNRLTEIRAEDLTFTPAEARSFLNDLMGLGLSAAQISALEERTEGWAAGLQLAALAMQPAGTNPADFIAGLTGSQRFILSYLTEEVLRAQPAQTQQFLLETSVLNRLTGDLCDELLQKDDRAPRSSAVLEALERANLFLVRLDEEGGWYRYHHLFADLLRARLQSTRPDLAAPLHRRASRWYARAAAAAQPEEAAPYASEAIEHALAAGDYTTAIALIETYAAGMIMQWYASSIQGWIKAIPRGLGTTSPKLNLTFAWMHLSKGEFQQAAPYLALLAEFFSQPEGSSDPGLLAEWLALQANGLNWQGQPAAGLALANQALEIAPPGHPIRGQIYMCQAAAYAMLDDPVRAEQAYQALIQIGQSSGSLVSELMGISGLGLMLIERGELQLAYQLAQRGVERMDQARALPPVASAVYGELAQVYYERRQLDLAERFFARAAQVSRLSGFPDAEIYADIIHSRLALAQGDVERAAREIEQVSIRMRAESPAVVREEAILQQVRVFLAAGRLADAEAALASQAAPGKDLPEIDPDRPLMFARARLVLCTLWMLLYRSRLPGGADDRERGLALASRLIEAARQRRYPAIVIEALLLRAQMQAADPAASQADLLRALEAAEPAGYLGIFVESGPAAAQALRELLANRRLDDRLARFARLVLDSCCPAPQPAQPAAGLVEPLTERELEVLRRIAAGDQYTEIAARLYISVNTVRTYVKAIYGKLGANNRTRAVLLARQHGLL